MEVELSDGQFSKCLATSEEIPTNKNNVIVKIQ